MQKLPHPPRLPFIGNMHQVLTMHPIERFNRLATQYGHVSELNVLGVRLILVNDYTIAQELFDETRFQKYIDLPFIYLREVAGDGLFTAWTHEPNWRKAHNILLPGFAQRSIRGYFPLMIDVLKRMFAKWYNLSPDAYIDVTDQMTRFTFETIGLCGFDYRFNNFATDQPHPFVTAMSSGVQTALLRAKVPRWMYWMMFKRRKKYRESVEYMNRTVDEIIQKRKANPEEYRNKIDFLSLMLNAQDKETGTKLEDVNIRYQILTFLVAGHETTATLLSFSLYYLSQHPHFLEQAYKEVDAVLGNNPDQLPSYDQVMSLKYVQQILMETLRLQPPMPLIEVYSTTDTTLANTYPIPADTAVLVFLQGYHQDKTVWGEDAAQFNPDRFAPDLVAQRDPNAFKPFGNGVRACIGRQFAMLEATLALGAILHRYKFHIKPGYVLQTDEIPTLKPVNFQLRLELRTEKDRFAPTTAHHSPVQHTADMPQQHPLVHNHPPITVLYGSNMGTSEEFARRLAADAQKRGFAVRLHTLDEAIDQMPSSKGFLAIISSTYNGYPPDNAARFKEWLPNAQLSASSVSYAVFGCGNSQWANSFQAFPHWIDAQLQHKGFQPLLPQGEGDASNPDFDDVFEDWYRRFWQAVYTQIGAAPTPNTADKGQHIPESVYTMQVLPNATIPYTPPTRSTTYPLTVSANESLLPSSDQVRAVRHLHLSLPQRHSYTTGDYLAVYPRNPQPLIAAIAAYFQLTPDTVIQLQSHSALAWLPCGQPIRLGDLLADYVELQDTITKQQLQTLAAWTECPPERQKLLQWADESVYKQEIAARHLSVWAIIQRVPACAINLGQFLQLLPALRLRYYSISSSARQHPQSLTLTVGILQAPHHAGQGIFEGICSHYLAGLPAGASLYGYVKAPNSDFRLPHDNTIPVVLIGAGTGISPLRAFYLERAHTHQQGQPVGHSYLFFGCRNEQDWLYADERKSLQQAGILTEFTAFSRANPQQKVYVQDVLWEQRDLVGQLLTDNKTVFYICGDANSMSIAVKDMLCRIYQEQTGTTADQAAQWLADAMHQTQRIRLDVWTS